MSQPPPRPNPSPLPLGHTWTLGYMTKNGDWRYAYRAPIHRVPKSSHLDGLSTLIDWGEPVPTKDFSGFDLAIGEVYGYRTWKMDDYGRLRAAVSSSPPWQPGVNVAKCSSNGKTAKTFWTDPSGADHEVIHVDLVQETVPIVQRQGELGRGFPEGFGSVKQKRTVAWTLTFADSTIMRVEEQPEWKTVQVDHEPPVETCGCGFYAYTDIRHDLQANTPHGIHGIVKATGRVLIGTKGFRAEKAEIVALLDPTKGGVKTAQWRVNAKAKLQKLYPDVPLLATRAELMEFAPLDSHLPEPGSEEFWALP